MDLKLKVLLVSGLVVGGGVVGLWSMSVAPLPPTVQAATQEATRARKEIGDHMDEFLRHHARTESALAAGHKERALAHLTVMTEITEELDAEYLHNRVPPEDLARLRRSLTSAHDAVARDELTAGAQVAALRSDCIRCHVANHGPRLGLVLVPSEQAPEATPERAP
ncbi:MAG: hypothetical protein AB2A00_32040 [Myxococcota bacterium]